MEETILHWSDRISGHLNVWKNVATHIYTQATYIVQRTISMQGMLMLRDLGVCPPGKFWKTSTPRLNLGAFQDLTIAISHVN